MLVAGKAWSWTGSSWTPLGHGPEPSINPEAAYDAARRTTVLYTGDPTAETWELSGRRWRLAEADSAPGPTTDHQLVYDGARREVLMVAGGSTWTWNGQTWTRRGPATGAGPMAYDAARGVVVRYWMGETYLWNDATWTRVAPGPGRRFSPEMTYDPLRQVVVFSGGTPNPGSYGALADTWEWDGVQWRQILPYWSILGRYGHGLAFDGNRNEVVLTAGRAWPWTTFDDTYTYNGERLRLLPPSPQPEGDTDLVWDSGRRRLVAFETPERSGIPVSLRVWENGPFRIAGVARHGQGCGTAVAPSLGALGFPRIGREEFALDVDRAPAFAPGAVLLSTRPASIPLGAGCTLYVDPTATPVLPLVAGPTGHASWPAAIPEGITGDAVLLAQSVLLDPAGAIGLALTGRLDLTLGE